MMKAVRWVSVIAASALAAACGSDSGGSDKNVGSVRMGLANPFSGPLATQGVLFEASMRLAQKQINDNGGIRGKRLDFVVKDTQTSAEAAAVIAQEFVDEGITAIASAGGSGSSFALLDVTVPADTVLIVGTAQTVALARESNDGLFFRTGSTSLDEGGRLAEVVAKDGYRKVAVIRNTHPYTTDMSNEFQKVFATLDCKDGPCEIMGEVMEYPVSVDAETFDFSPLVEEAMGRGPEAIMFSSYPPDANALFHAAAAAGYNGPLYTSQAAGNDNLTPYLTAEEAARVKWVTIEEPVGPSAQFVRQLWLDSGKLEADFAGPVQANFDAVFVLALALAHADSTDGQDIAASLREVANPPGMKVYANEWGKALAAIEAGEDIDYVGVATTVDFNELGDVTVGTVVKGYENGEPVILDK